MGIDAKIYVKTKDGQAPDLCDRLPSGFSVLKAEESAPDGATHEINQYHRYYGPGYERGPWPMLAAALMALHAGHNVETVWYFGDCHDSDKPFTPERVQEFSAHYMTNGDRPYRNG
jgi:hypothetical protein